MRVVVGQLAARDVDERENALAEVEAALHQAGQRGAELAVLPECSWPAYVLGTDPRDRWSEQEQRQALARIATATQAAGVTSVVGLALADEHGRLHNVAVVHGPDGSRIATVGKRFLWDIDLRWFEAAPSSAPVDTPAGRLGVLVCADGRMPEIARGLALQGAQILIDPTAWVTAGADPTTWTNPQYEFMLSARAWENGIPAVAANKVGVEEGMIAYCGRSVVLDRDGHELAVAPPDEPDLVVAEVTLEDAPALRGRPGATDHQLLVAPTRSLPAHHRRVGDLALRQARPRVVVVPGTPPDPGSRTARVIDDLAPALVVTAEIPDHREVVDHHGMGVATLGLDDLDGHEPARAAMLRGADLVVWRGPRDRVPLGVLRCRAAENRVFLVALDPDGSGDSWAVVVDPDGRITGPTGTSRRALVADLRLADARTKEMAPGTDVVAGRQPDSYGLLAGSTEVTVR